MGYPQGPDHPGSRYGVMAEPARVDKPGHPNHCWPRSAALDRRVGRGYQQESKYQSLNPSKKWHRQFDIDNARDLRQGWHRANRWHCSR